MKSTAGISAVLLALALLPDSAAAGTLQTRSLDACRPGAASCCLPDGPTTIPRSLRGKTVSQALALMPRQSTKVRVVERPSDGTAPGLVMASNPHADIRVCGDAKVILYVAESGPAKMPKFVDNTLAEARAKLTNGLAESVTLTACGNAVAVDFADPAGELRVVAQWPAQDSPVDRVLNRGELRLAPRLDFRQTFAQTTVAIARARLAERAALRGWTLDSIEPPPAPAAAASAPRGEPVIADTAIDSDTCRITAILGPPLEPTPPAPPVPPGSPVLPLTGGALLGLLGGRLMWARSRAAAAVVAAGASPVPAPAALRLRVRRDLPELPRESAPDASERPVE